ncbi:hypothetical protein cypCar_00026832 [Cyprinus carpio]|nr:hypothetical protein cypCar_00026832 [Cyprinus carpio]
MSESWRQHRKHVFVLSEAGKPIYSHYGNEEALSSTMGVMMALVSFVQAGADMVQSIFFFQIKKHFRPWQSAKRESQNTVQCVANTQLYIVVDISVANLMHFLYKPSKVLDHHRKLPQFTCPEMEVAYRSQEERIRLLDLFHNMHYRILSTSRPLKLNYILQAKKLS